MWRNKETAAQVHQVKARDAGLGSPFCPVADTAEMARVAESGHGDSVAARLVDTQRDRLRTDSLTEAEPAVDDGKRAGLLKNLDRAVGMDLADLHPLKITQNTAQPMAFVAPEICQDQMMRDSPGLILVAAGRKKDAPHEVTERARIVAPRVVGNGHQRWSGSGHGMNTRSVRPVSVRSGTDMDLASAADAIGGAGHVGGILRAQPERGTRDVRDPAALGLRPAHHRHGRRVLALHAVAVRHLEESVPRRHRPDLHWLEENIVARIACHLDHPSITTSTASSDTQVRR